MERSATVAVPLHITGFWVPSYSNDPLQTGSRGAGIVIRPMVQVTVSEEAGGGVSFIYNALRLDVPTIKELAGLLGMRGARIEVSSPVPLGVGYAASAASAIGAAYAWLMLAGNEDVVMAGRSAHLAEVKASTGLGDVIAILEGSHLEIRTRPGGPGIGEVVSIRLPRSLRLVTADLNHLSTSAMLSRMPDEIYSIAEESLNRLLESPDVEAFLEEAYMFSKLSGMLSNDVEEKVKACTGESVLGYFVKKKVLVIVSELGGLEDTVFCIRKSFGKARVFEPSEGGVRPLSYP